MALPKLIYTAAVPNSILIFRKNIIRELTNEFEIVVVTSDGPELKEFEASEGIRTIPVNIERRPSPFKDLVSLIKLYRVFRKEHPLIVHSMSAKCGLVSMLAAKFAGVPHRVHSFTGLAFPTAKGISRIILMITEKLTCMASNHLLPEGNGVKGALQEYITKKEMTVLGYGNIRGINLKTFDRTPEVLKVASKLKIDGVFTFLYVGRIVKDKGVDELITAFCRLHGEYPETRLVLVGPYEDKLNPISHDTHVAINTSSAIEAIGLKMGLELLAYYAASDCFVFPSYREGFPNVVIEAGAMSLPSIVTDIFGSNEIVEDGVNGLIVPPQDSVSLYDAMKRIFNDAFLRTSLANKARPMIASRYEESFVQKCLIDYYHQIIKQQYLM